MNILNLFKKEKVNPVKAAAFVDYEHWYYSIQNNFHLKPDPVAWRSELDQKYSIDTIMVFADFSHKGLREEITKIRSITNTIIETQNSFPRYKKDMTDFIMLDYIYQYVAEHPETGTIILFTGDGHFQSVTKYITQKLERNVIVYAIKNAFSSQLKNAATKSFEIPTEKEVLEAIYPLIISILEYISNKTSFPTFMRTVEAVANRNNIEQEFVHAALADMINKGWIEHDTQKLHFRTISTLKVNWTKLKEAGLWIP